MYCIGCGSNKIESNNMCATCAHASRKAARVKDVEPRILKKVSHKMAVEHAKYIKQRSVWLRGKKCQARFVHDCSLPLTVHHSCGRVGYYDELARENDVTLLLDVRFWIPLCLNAHQYIEEHPTFAKQNGYSEYRLTNKNL